MAGTFQLASCLADPLVPAPCSRAAPPAVQETTTGEAAAAAGPAKQTCRASIVDSFVLEEEVDGFVRGTGSISHKISPVQGFKTSMLPSFRPTAAVAVAVSFKPFLLLIERVWIPRALSI